MIDLFAGKPQFVVGQRLIAKADFGDEIKTRPVVVTAIRNGQIIVEATDGTPDIGQFNLQGRSYCRMTGEMNTWLEAV